MTNNTIYKDDLFLTKYCKINRIKGIIVKFLSKFI